MASILFLEAFDGILTRLEATGSLAELEDEFRASMKCCPFEGAAFAWWGYPPPVRSPDFAMASGSVSVDASLDDGCGDFWSGFPLLINDLPCSLHGASTVRVALVGPRRRFGVLTARFSAEAFGDGPSDIDWKGRLLLLAHVVQHRVGQWSVIDGPTLGRREIQCLKLAADGLKAKQIAITLGIGQQTVQFHLSRAREKLDCSNTVQAVAKAAQFGLLPDIAPGLAETISPNPKTPA